MSTATPSVLSGFPRCCRLVSHVNHLPFWKVLARLRSMTDSDAQALLGTAERLVTALPALVGAAYVFRQTR